MEQLRRMFNEALDSLQNAQRSGEQSKGGAKQSKKPSRYDYGKSFSEQINDFLAGIYPKYEELLVCKTPEIWGKSDYTYCL